PSGDLRRRCHRAPPQEPHHRLRRARTDRCGAQHLATRTARRGDSAGAITAARRSMSEQTDQPVAESIAPEFTTLTNLASRTLGASVMAANDEAFAQRENLINPWPPAFDPGEFSHKGKVYD